MTRQRESQRKPLISSLLSASVQQQHRQELKLKNAHTLYKRSDLFG